MLIKRNDKGNKVESLYDSSNILASSWDKTTNDLTITFKRGVQYVYKNVRATDYARFELAESQGAELNKRIKNVYNYEKLDGVDTADLVKEIYTYQKEEMSKAEKNLISVMKSFIIAHENQGSIDLKELSNIEFFINKVKETNEAAINE